ncbi:signal peptide peptidase SppA [Rhizobium sp. PP-F2F-G48]|uniref:S49 family peptidase n=1 Tax=Rhizobium sp. PP-F2F-G48 TaxID=2135651 RepID=UPI00104A6714|nr:S49 family peptidase [Rhizobium sp. PP-F2F-G48]TCM56162.1 signal peptide peptidase SppA [Rhizobium sp. PP-F2F-G48]
MKYIHILAAVASEYWAMQPEKMHAVIEFLATQAADIKFTAEEIEARIAPQTAKAVARREGAVAVVSMRGVISNRMNMMGNISGGGGTSTEQFGQQLLQVRDDDSVKAVIVDTDSPGGAVSGTDEAAEIIASFKGIKPIVAQVNSTAASAAYWMVSNADEIVVTPSGWVGSIGVYSEHDNIRLALEKAGIEKTLISAGPFKTEANPFGPLSEEALSYRQAQIDAFYGMFVDRVARGRNVSSETVRETFGKGRMVLAKDAVSLGMADRVGTMQETLQRFGAGAGAPPERKRAMATERMKRAAAL